MKAGERTLRRLAVLVVVLGFWSVLTPPASAQTYIFGRADFPTGNAPAAIVSADFNGDGRLDLAVVVNPLTCHFTCPPGSVAILLGKPDGTFDPPTDFPTGHSPSAIAIGDFNRDGKLDLVVVNQGDNTVSVLLGNGDGTFQPHIDYATGASPHAVAVADFNGDGKLDLAVADQGAGTVSILIGKGDGTFAPHFDYPAGGDFSLVAGDFNGDGKIDLVVTSSGANTVSILFGNGDGSFKTPVSVNAGSVGNALATADLNGDGKLDLVVSGGGITILMGNGDGTFQAPVQYPYLPQGSTAATYFPVIVDLNGDGKLDVVVAAWFGVAVFRGNGDGTFQPAVNYNLAPSGGAFNAAAVGDFNGDGLLDVAVTNAFLAGVTVVLDKGNGTFQNPTDYSIPAVTNAQVSSVVTGDFNNDGKLDLAGTAGLHVSVFLGNGDGTFQAPVSFNPGRQTVTLASGDFNKDGKLDLAVIEPFDNLVSIFLGKGDGTFTAGQTYATGPDPQQIVTADFNGDGKLDLAVRNVSSASSTSPGSISIFLGNGDGTFQNRVDYPVGANNPQWFAVADLNKDGKLDIAAVATSNLASGGTLSILLGNGNGTFQPHADTPLEFPSSVVVAGDFNGDGNPDLAISSGGGQVSILLGNGTGSFNGVPVNTKVGSGVVSLTAADLNGDGKLDLLLNGNDNLILLGKGDGTFQVPVYTSLAPSSSPTVAADFNGDGGLDLAVPEQGDGTVAVLLNLPFIGLPARIAFPGQGVGTTSAPVTLEVSNPGSMAIALAGITRSGASFAETNDCGASLVSGTHCNVNVTFSPTAAATVMGAVTVTDNAPGSPQAVPLIGTGINGPFAIVTPSSLSFGDQLVGTASAVATVVLTNTGNASLTISSIAVTGANAGDFSQANTCGGALAAGANCKILVKFKPTQTGFRTATLTVSDSSAGSPQSVVVSGNGTAPGVSLSPSSLSFGSQLVSATTSAQSVTLTNNGDAPLAISNITASGDFAMATSGTTCSTGSPVAAGASCTVAVTFTPTAGGSRTGTLSISDGAPGSPQTLALAGTGEDFSLGAASGASTSATVTAGQTATYMLSISPTAGFSQAVSLGCSGAPSAANCTVSPMSVTLDGSHSATATVTVTTVARSLTLPRPRGGPPALLRYKGLPLILGLMVLASLIVLVTPRRRRAWAGLAVILTALVLWAACGGGGNTGGGGGSSGTPAGTYSLTVTGTFTSGQATLKQTVVLTLNVN